MSYQGGYDSYEFQFARRKMKPKKEEHVYRKRLKAFYIYCMTNTTAHGFIQIVRQGRKLFDKVFWILIIILAMIPCYIIGKQAIFHYLHHPTVISLERDHWNWESNFPAVTLCPRSIFDDALSEIASELKKDETLLGKFFEALFFGTFDSYGELQNFTAEFGDISPEKYIEYNQRVVNLGRNYNADYMGQSNAIVMVITEFGICFQFNSMVGNYSSMEYRMLGKKTVLPEIEVFRANPGMEEPTLRLNQLDTDILVFVHPSNDIIDLMSKKTLVPNFKFAIFQVEMLTTWTPDSVMRLMISQRGCRFINESNLKYFAIYTYKMCKVECRIEMALKLCQCLPYYYNNLYGAKICDLKGMICLSKHAYQLIQLQEHNGTSLCPDCLPNCYDDFVIISSKNIQEWFMGGVMQIILLFGIRMRFKRTVIFTETDLLVQIGGLTGLCLGLSILSLIELIYFFTLRFFWGVIRSRVA